MADEAQTTEKAWKLSVRGGWTEVEIPAWQDGETDGDYMRRVGLHESDRIGVDGFDATLYARSRDSAWPAEFGVLLVFFDEGRWLLADDMPSALKVWGDASAIAGRAEANEILKDLNNMARKCFRVWHGHEPYMDCRECDPEAVRRRDDKHRAKATSDSGQGTA